ncbi:MAG TPA: crossover junction endodeoxyribonuclease RuvC [Candidatus Binataceae bacterium]|nr:crossover junction endodeoxyribonuclease RuvC [Candidatus Binataceae bacterium]
MRIIGVDPGNAVTGYGVVERTSAPLYIAAGAIRNQKIGRGPRRLAALYDGLIEVIDKYTPDVMSLERNFVATNVQSAFTLGEARAIAMLAAAHRNLNVFEYTPTDVKLTIAGYGRADKRQVEQMVRRTLTLDDAPLIHDATDALAIALCHAFREGLGNAVRAAETREAELRRKPLRAVRS